MGGSCAKANYGAQGYASNFTLSVMDRDWEEGLTEGQAVKVVEHCIREIHMRFLINQSNFIIKVIDKRGLGHSNSARTRRITEELAEMRTFVVWLGSGAGVMSRISALTALAEGISYQGHLLHCFKLCSTICNEDRRRAFGQRELVLLVCLRDVK